MLAVPAFAQDATPAQDDSATSPSEEVAAEAAAVDTGPDCAATPDAAGCRDIVVTGSRIRRPNLESAVPVTTVTGDEFFETGRTSVGDTLNELPALRSTFSQANSTRFLGTGGLNILDLRGLGTQRTLTLVNGRRHVASNILGNAVEVDTNTIPTDLIERVDVVTGGNSAIYGSDAIAGVVNFVLKDHYEGAQIRAQAGTSKYNDADNYYISALVGKNFAGGRGNVAVNLEYAQQDDWYASRRGKCFSTTCGYVTVDTDSAANPSDNQPDRVYFEDIRSSIYTNGGAMYFCCGFNDPSSPNIGGSGLFTVPYQFLPDGSLAPITGERVGLSYFGSFIGGNGDNFRDGTQFGFSPKLKRYSANLVAHFEVSPALVPFVEAKFVRTDSLSNASGPFFGPAIGEINPNTGFDREAVFLDNPYLSPQALNTLAGLSYFYLYKNYVDLTNREEKARRDTYRVVAGLRGDFNDDWSYEVSANFGKLKETTKILGNVNTQRFLLAFDAARDPNTGEIVCRSSFDPDARLSLQNNLDPAFAAAQLANDVAQCVPLNPFGRGNISQAAKNYVLQDSLAKGWIKEFVLSGFMSGDTSEWINLPGGPIGFVLGGEYRNYDVNYKQDAFTEAGLTFYNAIPEFSPPKFGVKEVYGEVRLPIIKNSFIDELTVSGAARYADYKTFGGVWAYNAGLEFAPVKDLRFRGNYSKAVRAPSLADAYTPLGSNFAPGFADPCDNDNINANANRAKNCAADPAVPAGFNYNYTKSLAFLSGGNPNLKPETSKSLTLGGVLQPRFLPGFALSVDYYSITVKDVITSPSAQATINACYDLPDLNNQFCSLFARAGASGGPQGEAPGRILENSLNLVPLNYAKLKVRGIDLEASYRRQLGTFGRLETRFIFTHSLQNDAFLDPTQPGFADQIQGELGDPENAFVWNTSLKKGKFTFGHRMRYIGKMTVGPWEATHSKNGEDPSDPDYAEDEYYRAISYHDVRVGFDANDKFNFYLGIDDLTNRKPPKGLSGAGGGSGIYRNVGRFFYGGIVAKF